MQVKFIHRSILFLLILLILFPFGDLLAQEFTLSEKITARFHGPFHFRFLFQPIIAIILGLKDGKTDAKLNRPPYIIELFTNKENRRENLKNAFNSVAKPFMIGIVLDAVVQFHLFNSAHLYGAVLVGGLLVGLPYALARGIRNRLTKREIEIS